MKIRIICGLCLLLASLLFIFPSAVLAQEETIELTTPYTKLEAVIRALALSLRLA